MRSWLSRRTIFWISFSNPSKIAVTASGGMRRLLEWSLGAASDDNAALDGGYSQRGSGNELLETRVSLRVEA